MENFEALDTLKNAYVLDMHAHVAGIGIGSDCYVAPNLLENWRYGIYLKAFGVSKQDLRDKDDHIIFKRIATLLSRSQFVNGAVLLALDKAYRPDTHEPDQNLTEVYVPNDFVRDGTAGYPDLYYGASINPYRQDWLEELQRVYEDGAVLIKWLPAIQHIDPSDQAITPFYQKLLELNLPLLVHTGAENSFSTSHDTLGDPQLLHLPLQLGVKVIAAHVATTGSTNGEMFIDRLLPMITQYDNLYTDISSLTQLNKLYYPAQVIQRPDIFSKLLYGSDFPLINAGVGPFKLVSPWYFCKNLSFTTIRKIQRVKNTWDRDLLIKLALGFPIETYTRPAQLLLNSQKPQT